MLTIRPEQMRAFELAALRRFEDATMEHSKAFSPRLCAVLGDAQLRIAVHSAIERAMGYGFTDRGPIRLFVELTFLCGSAFDTDPQYRPAGDILRAPGDQMQRAERLHQGQLDYLDRVSGAGNANVRHALAELSLYARAPIAVSPNDFADGMLRELTRVFPQKAAYIGEARLTELIEEGRAAARGYEFHSLRAQVLIVVLMFAFGHGCTDDPLYPWIARTLADSRIVDPAARAARLEKKAMTWLAHVLAGNATEARA